jgi:hypothetical protein
MHVVTEPLGPEQRADLVRDIAGLLVSSAPDGWQLLRMTFGSTVGVDTASLMCTDGNGEESRIRSPMRALTKLSELRNGMYTAATGAWYTAVLTIRPPCRYDIEYDYDNEPAFTPPLTAGAYALDFEHFPRSEENTPTWLKRKLDEAKRA